jgi:hypothetical protein
MSCNRYGGVRSLNCIICKSTLPHNDKAEINCKNELLKMFESLLLKEKETNKQLQQEIFRLHNEIQKLRSLQE